MKELVSVIITTYKRSQSLLETAVDSVLRQTYDNLELIVVDDNGVGSEIQKQNELLLGEKERVRYIPNARNSGAQFSRNIGILSSKGDYIAFLDDDDYWREDKLVLQMELMQSRNLGMVFCDGIRIKEGQGPHTELYQRNPCFDREITFEMQLQTDFIGSTSQVLVRKCCFAAVGLFDPEMQARQDYEMWLRITRRFKVMGIPQTLFFYREHLGERISKNPRPCIDSYLRLLKLYGDEYGHNSLAKSNLLVNLARYCSYERLRWKTLFFMMRAFVLSPRTTVMQICNKMGKRPSHG